MNFMEDPQHMLQLFCFSSITLCLAADGPEYKRKESSGAVWLSTCKMELLKYLTCGNNLDSELGSTKAISCRTNKEHQCLNIYYKKAKNVCCL